MLQDPVDATDDLPIRVIWHGPHEDQPGVVAAGTRPGRSHRSEVLGIAGHQDPVLFGCQLKYLLVRHPLEFRVRGQR